MLSFDGIRLHTHLASDHRWGAKWAWRIVRFVHAIPFLALAFGFGCFNNLAWGAEPIILGGILCSGLVAAGMAINWFREWRRGY
jgi:hypothetical protein